ncbi:hypothetical protein CZ794_11810 [Psychrobacter sp. JB385]|nr:hypothetical protein CZ794_11810 [Psychrobacter sp. JB385]
MVALDITVKVEIKSKHNELDANTLTFIDYSLFSRLCAQALDLNSY